MTSINRLPSQVRIAAKTTTNVNGGQSVSYAAGSLFPALVVDASPKLKLIYAQRHLFVSHVIYYTAATAPNVGDVAIFGVKNFFIVGMLSPSGTGRIFELHCSEAVPGSLIIEVQ